MLTLNGIPLVIDNIADASACQSLSVALREKYVRTALFDSVCLEIKKAKS